MRTDNAIKTARIQQFMTQKELAEVVRVSRQTINMIEQGRYNPTIKLCLSICKALGKSLDELFWDERNDNGDMTNKADMTKSPSIRNISVK